MLRARHVAALLVPFALVGCATFEFEPINILSTPQEIELGQELSTEVEKEKPLLDNPAIQAYVGEIGARLARNAPRQDVAYTFKVIDDAETVNAFALPGGFMYVYTGLMTLCDNEAELAAVMAHEIAHVSCHHHGEQYTRLYGYDALMRVILGEDPAQLHKLLADLIGASGAMYYSRENEREADAMGMEILFRAGYRPEAMLTFMDKLGARQEKTGQVWIPIFASHPRTPNRLALLDTLVQKYPPSMRQANPLYAERYQEKVLSVLK